MNKAAELITVTLYLLGTKLDPAYISSVLGVDPTTSRTRGQITLTRTNKEIIAKVGSWTYSSKLGVKDVSSAVNEVLQPFKKSTLRLKDLSGVDQAHLDIFLAVDTDNDGGGECAFQLTAADLHELDLLGLTVKFTVALVRA